MISKVLSDLKKNMRPITPECISAFYLQTKTLYYIILEQLSIPGNFMQYGHLIHWPHLNFVNCPNFVIQSKMI